MTTIKTNAGGSSDVTLDDGSQTSAKNTVTISGNIKFTNSVYSQVTLSDGKQTTAMNVVDLSGGGTPTAAEVSFDPANLSIITGTNVQSALQQVDASLNGMVKIAQGAENAGKVLTVDGSGNVVPTAGYATESWVNQQIQTQIGTIETALAGV